MSIEFRLIADPDNTVYKTVRIASQAYAIGDAVMQDYTADAIDVVPATSSTTTPKIYGVAMSTQVSTDTTLLIALITDRQTWAADVTNTAATNDNYQRMALTDKGTVNNSHTDQSGPTGVFQQQGTLSSTRVVGRFITGSISA